MAESVTLRAHAKVNLVLEVLGTRPDGYHEIDTVVQTVGLHDLVTVRRGGPPLTVTGPRASGVPLDGTNLGWRALTGLAALLGRESADWGIAIEKHIPAAGGMGGGSADAAAVLRALQQLWGPVEDELLLEVAAGVGSDEPALVLGGTVRAQGRGERVTPLPPVARHDVVLFLPPTTIERKTARMFAALDGLPFDSGAVAASAAAGRPAHWTSVDIYNSFERVGFDLFPDLAGFWQDLESCTGEAVRLSGAGPTLFWIGPPGQGAGVAAAARSAGCLVIETTTIGDPWTP